MLSNFPAAALRLCPILALILLAGCHFHFRESPGGEGSMQFGSSQPGCLSGAAQRISAFLKGEASQREVLAVADCFSSSLQLFGERTRGADPDFYTPNELRGFLERYFLKTTKISDGLLREAMELKCTLLGGSPERLTRDELARAADLIRIVGEEAAKLEPHLPLTPTWARTQNAASVDAAARTLESAAQAIARHIQKTGYPYLFSRFDVLREEIEKLLADSDSGTLGRFGDRLPLARAVKSLLVGPEGDRIGGHEWVNFLTTSARWYGIFLKASQFPGNYPSPFAGAGRERISRILLDSLALIEESASRHPGRVIPFEEFEALIDAIRDSELPISGLTPDRARNLKVALKKYLRPLFRKVFGPEPGPGGRNAKGFTQAGVQRLVNFAVHWSEGQRYLDQLFAKLTTMNGPAQDKAPGFTITELQALAVKDLFPSQERNPVLEDAAARIQDIVRKQPPLFFGEDYEITILPRSAEERFTLHTISIANLLYELIRVLIQGYGGDPERARSEIGVTGAEFYSFFEDIKDIGFAARLFDPDRDNEKMIALRFQEGNLFTHSANGDDYLDLDEGSQLLAFLFSTYRLSTNIHNSIVNSCNGWIGPDDVFGKPTVGTGCYREQFFGNAHPFWDRLPGMVEYYARLADEERAPFEQYLETASRLSGYTDRVMINSNDSLGFAGVLQYVEALMSRFDRNQSGFIDYAESKAAFPVFRKAIEAVVEKRKLSKHVPEKDYEALFTYLLAHGEPPKSNLAGLVSWSKWKLKSRWSFQASRLTLIKIFAMLQST